MVKKIKKWDQKSIDRFHSYFNTLVRKNKDYYKGNVIAKGILKISKAFLISPILDVGCGSGDLVKLLKLKKYNIKGIDPTPINSTISKGYINKIPFDDGSFNTVFCTDVIEHLDFKTLNKGIDELYRILNNNGSLIITTIYNEDLDEKQVYCPFCDKLFHKWNHQQVFDEKRVRRLFKKFEVVDIFKTSIKNYINKKFDRDSIIDGNDFVIILKK